MSINYPALKTELNTDPLSLGYAPLISAGNLDGVAALLNALTGAGAASIHRDDVLPGEVIDAISTTDFGALTTIQSQQLQLLLSMRQIDCTRNNLRANLVSVFPVGGGSHGPIVALTSRIGSRAEVLFGIHTHITSADVAQALAS